MAYYPQTDGQSECMNQWVKTYLRHFVIGCQNNWSNLLSMAEFAHLSWKHEHMKHMPHELITRINPTASINTPEDSVPAAQEHLKRLIQARVDAQKALQKHIKPLNPPCSFVPGNKIWLDGHNLPIKAPSRSLNPRRFGPYAIIKMLSPVTYRIKLPPLLHMHNVFHVDLLTPYYETDAHGANYSQPPPELIHGQEEYEVKEIIKDRYFRWKRQYLVKWLGYPVSENSWVNAKDLHSPKLLAEYLHLKA